MTKDEAIKIMRAFGFPRIEQDFRDNRPAWWCDKVLMQAAEDTVEGLIALGVLKVDQPSPQDSSGVPHD